MMDNQLNKKNLVWNMLGSMIYAISSMVLGIIVTRIIGDVMGGIFFFAFSTLGQQLYIIAYFGMRPIQVTDTGYEYRFAEYIRFRIMTSALAMLCGVLYSAMFAGDSLKFTVYLAIIAYKVGDGFIDCLESEFQRKGKLYKTGQSLAMRTVFSLSVFIIVLNTTRNLLISSLTLLPALIVGFGGYLYIGRNYLDFSEGKGAVTRNLLQSALDLFHSAKWLFISSFLDLYIFAAAKFAVNEFLSEEANAYFSIIFIPTSVINLMAGFIIRPVLTKLSLDYEQRRIGEFRSLVLKISGVIAVLTALGMGAAYLLGIPVLLILLGESAREALWFLRIPLVLVILGGGFYAILNLIYYALVILKRKGSIFVIYLIGTALAYFVCRYMVREDGLFGAALSYALVMFIMMAMFVGMYAWGIGSLKNIFDFGKAGRGK